MTYDFYKEAADPKLWENLSRIAANTERREPASEPQYAFTEIINVTFASPINLRDTSTSESQLWERTIKAYLEHPGTTKIWFGQLLDSTQVMKLIIDWASVEERNAFHASEEMASLLATWTASQTPITTSRPEYYVFGKGQGYREESFSLPGRHFEEKTTVFVAFHLPDDWEPSPIDHEDDLKRDNKIVWSSAWSSFRHTALKSNGAWVGDKSLDGWSTGVALNGPIGPLDGQKSFMGVFRFENAATARRFVAYVHDPPQTLDSVYGVGNLRRIAQRGMNAEAVNMLYQSA